MLTTSNNIKVVELKNITKVFGSKVANLNVNLDLYKGEILSILGENGSGKTTSMNIISGLYAPDEGSIYINGELAKINSPHDSLMYGIGMVHQHFKLVDVFTAAENIVLGLDKQDYANFAKKIEEQEESRFAELRKQGKEPSEEELKESKKRINAAKSFNIKNAASRIKEMCDRYGFELDPNKKVYNMTVSEKQTLEIVKALYRNANILILDEPTAVLTPQEIDRLFMVIQNMRNDGKSIVIITHKLNEVMRISDRVAIFRKGEHVATVETNKTSIKELTDMMVGAKVDLEIERSTPTDVADRLFVNNLSVKNNDGRVVINDVSFVARSGEILGIAGISGSGQKELLEAIQGLRPLESGEIIFHNPKKDKPATFFHKTLKKIKALAAHGAFHDPDGKRINFKGMSNKEIRKMVNDCKVLFYEDEIVNLKGKNPLQIRELGIRLSFVPEDRLGMGLVSNMNLVDNTMLRSYRHGHWIFLDRERPRKLIEKIIKELDVSTPGTNTQISKLSGGNVQKVLVGREIALAPKVFMAAYPVRGLDINSSYTIYNLLDKQKCSGIAVIYVGEDLDVLLALCDRIMVLCDGRISGFVDARKATKEQIGEMMTRHGEVQ
ncbi:MAG: ABC transporter ATP-binding protein [Bacilli bacterium]|nr:ABC transporter ATP-binding protein [Bacilli bacterium]